MSIFKKLFKPLNFNSNCNFRTKPNTKQETAEKSVVQVQKKVPQAGKTTREDIEDIIVKKEANLIKSCNAYMSNHFSEYYIPVEEVFITIGNDLKVKTATIECPYCEPEKYYLNCDVFKTPAKNRVTISKFIDHLFEVHVEKPFEQPYYVDDAVLYDEEEQSNDEEEIQDNNIEFDDLSVYDKEENLKKACNNFMAKRFSEYSPVERVEVVIGENSLVKSASIECPYCQSIVECNITKKSKVQAIGISNFTTHLYSQHVDEPDDAANEFQDEGKYSEFVIDDTTDLASAEDMQFELSNENSSSPRVDRKRKFEQISSAEFAAKFSSQNRSKNKSKKLHNLSNMTEDEINLFNHASLMQACNTFMKNRFTNDFIPVENVDIKIGPDMQILSAVIQCPYCDPPRLIKCSLDRSRAVHRVVIGNFTRHLVKNHVENQTKHNKKGSYVEDQDQQQDSSEDYEKRPKKGAKKTIVVNVAADSSSTNVESEEATITFIEDCTMENDESDMEKDYIDEEKEEGEI